MAERSKGQVPGLQQLTVWLRGQGTALDTQEVALYSQRQE